MRRNDARRGYDDACGTAHALELIGERWALLVLRELLLGPRRFSELRADLPGVSANVLTQRLSELEVRGLVRRRRLPPPASVQVYEATEWGLETATLIRELGRWAARSPAHDPTLPLSGVSIMLSFTAMLNPERARGLAAAVAFRFGEVTYLAEVEGGKIHVRRGEPGEGEAMIIAPPTDIAGVVYGGAPLDLLKIEGDRRLAKRFLSLFTLPPKADVPPGETSAG
ncbi:winged helix-turn-helix transcriptional regulator [Sphingomonas sp. GCM10030256]|uniref:winged helix-turn-helix transcriptional regulator n=1 Tax=Sphingomonas sp. GCM10030256 TaxID=3273427 RepID=UPI00360C6F4B